MKNCLVKRKLIALYELFYEARRILVLRTKYRLRIMSPEHTLRYIKREKCSIARYGDGEFDHILGLKSGLFQAYSRELAERLIKVLNCKDKRLLLCIPRCYNTTKGCNEHSRTFWIEWGKKDDHHKKIVNLIRSHTGRNYLFGDAQITRPYIDWVNDKRANRTFPMLKRLWEGQNILIIEGEKTRMGVGNDLFSGAFSVRRILAPAVNAFECYDAIKDTVIRNYRGELILMALGPTATLLAADFSMMDMWALDIGHIDIEYEWYLQGVKQRIPISGKFTNEATDGHNVADCEDSIYLAQIVDRVCC